MAPSTLQHGVCVPSSEIRAGDQIKGIRVGLLLQHPAGSHLNKLATQSPVNVRSL